MDRFEADWLAARASYDEDALDRAAVAGIGAWAAGRSHGRPLVVVDLGSGTGAALRRAIRWVAPRPVHGYAIDRDGALLAHAAWNVAHPVAAPRADVPVRIRAERHDRPNVGRRVSMRLGVPERAAVLDPVGGGEAWPAVAADGASAPGSRGFGAATRVMSIVADVLEPLDGANGPPDGTVDLVVAHALADLVPLGRLAERCAALLGPGGLAHIALVYDGLTHFVEPPVPALDRSVLAAFHRDMDRQRPDQPGHAGSRSGRLLAQAFAGAGFEIVADRPSVWRVASADGGDGRRVLDRLIRYVADGARASGTVSADDIAGWEAARRQALETGTLTARVHHRDLLVRAHACRSSGVAGPA